MSLSVSATMLPPAVPRVLRGPPLPAAASRADSERLLPGPVCSCSGSHLSAAGRVRGTLSVHRGDDEGPGDVGGDAEGGDAEIRV